MYFNLLVEKIYTIAYLALYVDVGISICQNSNNLKVTTGRCIMQGSHTILVWQHSENLKEVHTKNQNKETNKNNWLASIETMYCQQL